MRIQRFDERRQHPSETRCCVFSFFFSFKFVASLEVDMEGNEEEEIVCIIILLLVFWRITDISMDNLYFGKGFLSAEKNTNNKLMNLILLFPLLNFCWK